MAGVCGDEETCCSSSVCPLCRRCFDVALILPCSHTLCGRCLTEGAGLEQCGGVRGVTSRHGEGAMDVPSDSEDGFKLEASRHGGGVRGVVSPHGGGAMDVPSSFQEGVTSTYGGGVMGVASTPGGGVIDVPSDSQDRCRGVASRQGGGAMDVPSDSQGRLKEVASTHGGGAVGVSFNSGGRVKGVSFNSHPICAVLCPNCRHSVELPCFDWSSALTCLPFDPTVRTSPGWSRETDGSTDLSEEEMEQSVSGLLFTLDSSCCDSSLHLSSCALSVTFTGHVTSAACPDRCVFAQVCAGVSVCRGQYYWEVDVCNSACYRIGVMSSCDGRGWWLERRGSVYHTVFDGRRELLPSIPPQLKTVGVFLNVGGASITFHNSVTQEFLAAVPAHFSIPLRPALQLAEGRLKLRPGLPPPNHVFLCHSSTYRGPGGAGPGRWRRDVCFGSVRAVVQKFEQMSSVSDSDSGLVSTVSSLSEHNSTERL